MKDEILKFDHQTNSWIWVSMEKHDEMFKIWSEAFPQVNIRAEFAKMKCWLMANPEKAQKKRWLRFVNNWLNNADKNAKNPYSKAGESKTTFMRIPAEREYARTRYVAEDDEFDAIW